MRIDDHLTTKVHRIRDTVVISLIGELDYAGQQEVNEAIADSVTLSGLATMRVNATALRFIDSSGVRMLLLARELAEEHGLAFTLDIALNGPVPRLFALSGLADWLADVTATGPGSKGR